MKRNILFMASFGILILIATPAIGPILGLEKAEIVFEKNKVPEGILWSPNFVLTEDGLVSPEVEARRTQQGWIQTQKIPAGLSWRPPKVVNITLTVNGTTSDSVPVKAYVRYGCDGVHWSTWYYMPEGKEPSKESLKTYEYQLQLPRRARESYLKLMWEEWYKTDPNWNCDEDEFCRWLAKEHPEFFTENIPVIGYVQFLLEYDSELRTADIVKTLTPEQFQQGNHRNKIPLQFKIKSLSVQMSWGVSGLHTEPKSGKWLPLDSKWNIDLRERYTANHFFGSLDWIIDSKWNFDLRELQKQNMPTKK